MIDWTGLFFNGLWILALAILLALWSWTSWQARQEGVRFRVVWAHPVLQRFVVASLTLFCVSMAALSELWWERLLWCSIAVICLVQPLTAWWLRGRAVQDRSAQK